MKKIAVFISGSGSDMQSVIDGCNTGDINGKVSFIVASKADIFGIVRAKKENIEFMIFDRKNFLSPEDKDQSIAKELIKRNIDLVVLAGYLSIVTNELLKHYEGKIVNIHPSLIPKYCGMGYYGMKVHSAVIEAKEKFSGCTVHYVDAGADTGTIIEQAFVSVTEEDTAESLQKKVLAQEHILLPKVIKDLCKIS